MAMKKKYKIAFIVQQCGTEVLAGAERYALNLALALANLGCEVKILTTQSSDYNTWNNTLQPTEHISTELDTTKFHEKPAEIEIIRFPNFSFRKPFALKVSKLIWRIEKLFTPKCKSWLSRLLDNFFLWAQGPWCPELWNYLKNNSQNYDLLIFKSYLYAPCVQGLRHSDKSVKKLFIPAAHPEFAFYRPFVGAMLQRASALGFVSSAEKDLVEKTWSISRTKEQLLLPPGLGNEWSSLKETKCPEFVRPIVKNLGKYFLVLGRMDKGKNLDLILNNTVPGVTVAFAGPGHIDAPKAGNFVILGKVSEAEKSILLENALALIAVSKNEAFSMTTAEAMAKGCPVIGWSGSAAISELISKYGGVIFTSIDEYREQLLTFTKNEDFREKALPDMNKVKLELSWKKSAERVLQWLEQKND